MSQELDSTTVSLSSNRRCLQRLLPYARPYWRGIALATAAGLLTGLVSVGQVAVLRSAIDRAVGAAHLSQLFCYAGLLVALVLAEVGGDALHNWRMAFAGQAMVRDLQNALNQHIQCQSDEFFVTHSPGELAQLMFQDTAIGMQAVGMVIAGVVRHGFALAAMAAYLLRLDARFGLAACGTYLGAACIVRLTSRALQSRAAALQQRRALLSQRFLVHVAARDVLRLCDPAGRERDRLCRENSAFHANAQAYARVRCLIEPVSHLLGGIFAVGMVCLMFWRVRTGRMDPGMAVAVAVTLSNFYRPMKAISRISASLREAFASAHRVFRDLDRSPFWKSLSFGDGGGPIRRIELRRVCYQRPQGLFALRDIDLTMGEGSIVALVGATGAGKSTIARVLLGALRSDSGQVLVDGTPIEQVAARRLASQFLYVPQRCPVIGDTLREEVTLGDPSISQLDLDRAAISASLDPWISSLPDGWDTRIGPGGLAISGGERQRLAIARAFLGQRSVYVLDEATSELDVQTEARVLDALRTHIQKVNGMALIISHRMTNVVGMAQVVVVDSGRLLRPCPPTAAEQNAQAPSGAC